MAKTKNTTKEIGTRIKELRLQKGLTQQQLADKVNMTYVQIGRYERLGAMPGGDALKKLADVLGTTSDFLMNGNRDQNTAAILKDRELLYLFKAVEELSAADKHLVKTFLDAFVTKRHVQKLAK
jgi:transcriptional regulator with XRE-family HTH domain